MIKIFFKPLFENKNLVFYWMCLCSFMILCMVSIGGVTRLTNSGLSIVEWKPVTGIIPPLSKKDWNVEFGKYKQSPEFKLINNKIKIEEFKNIFWLEFIHRLAGRIVGIVFFIPAIIFWNLELLENRTKKSIISISIFGLLQGFMGWYMVKSGLSFSPYVSHFRLTLHLLLALVIFGIAIDESIKLYYKKNYNYSINKFNILCIGLTALQIAFGGLVAGLDAGLIYSTFPLMNGKILPEELYFEDFNQFLYNPGIVQFFHRIIAYALSSAIIYLCVQKLRAKKCYMPIFLIFLLCMQFTFGVLTLIFQVPILLASLHQLFAFLLFATLIFFARKA